jgi:cell division protein FtsL
MATRAATVGTGTAIPRRRSGPARPAPRRKQSTESFAALGRMALRVPDARVLDRLIRGRLWIGLIAGSLVVLVFMQVSLLKLNTGISADVMQSQSLQRDNAELRASVSSLDSGQRIQDIAAARGMVMPDDGQLRFLRAVPPGNGAGAAQAITAPDVQGAQQRAQAMLAQSQQQAANAAAAQQSAMAQQQQAATTGTAGTVTTTPTATTPTATTPTATTSTGPTQ